MVGRARRQQERPKVKMLSFRNFPALSELKMHNSKNADFGESIHSTVVVEAILDLVGYTQTRIWPQKSSLNLQSD